MGEAKASLFYFINNFYLYTLKERILNVIIMKKLIYALIAIVLMIFVTSCQTTQCECVITTDLPTGGTSTTTKVIDLEAGEKCSDLENAVQIPGITLDTKDLDVNIKCRAIY